tara:strand:+ start:66 stop:665 length:600 start_codon:yes stop_codon:yes gene_type:complete
MEPTVLLFYMFATILLGAAIAVISVKNPVHAALFLILSFFSASAIWILLGAEFLALTLVLVYVGAVMVLFLFVIMMARLDLAELKKNFLTHLSVALPVGGILLFEMFAIITYGFTDYADNLKKVSSSSNTYQIGMRLYTEYFLAFQIAAVILLVAMIAAIAITLKGRKPDVKGQNPSEQVVVDPSERLSLVKVDVKEKS